MELCFKDPTALLSVTLNKRAFQVDSVLLHRDDFIVLQMKEERVVIGDLVSHQLLRVNHDDVRDIEHNVVLDMKEKGERWEGDVFQNKPYGWGVLYDSENRKKYEGFRIGDVNVCYGIEYYPDLQRTAYKGEWCEGKRMGRGFLLDRNGETVFDGEWVNNRPLSRQVEITNGNKSLHSRVEELIVKDNSCNEAMLENLNFSFMPKLRELKIGKNCFNNGRGVDLIGLKELERVVICNGSLTNGEMNPILKIEDCEKMKELVIGEGSCCGFTGFAVSKVPSLKKIELYGNNFWTSPLLLKGD